MSQSSSFCVALSTLRSVTHALIDQRLFGPPCPPTPSNPFPYLPQSNPSVESHGLTSSPSSPPPSLDVLSFTRTLLAAHPLSAVSHTKSSPIRPIFVQHAENEPVPRNTSNYTTLSVISQSIGQTDTNSHHVSSYSSLDSPPPTSTSSPYTSYTTINPPSSSSSLPTPLTVYHPINIPTPFPPLDEIAIHDPTRSSNFSLSSRVVHFPSPPYTHHPHASADDTTTLSNQIYQVYNVFAPWVDPVEESTIDFNKNNSNTNDNRNDKMSSNDNAKAMLMNTNNTPSYGDKRGNERGRNRFISNQVGNHVNISHLAQYGARYYTYSYCAVFAHAIWGQCFADNLFNRQKGKVIREHMFQRGGTQHPLDTLAYILDSWNNTDNPATIITPSNEEVSSLKSNTDHTNDNNENTTQTTTVTNSTSSPLPHVSNTSPLDTTDTQLLDTDTAMLTDRSLADDERSQLLDRVMVAFAHQIARQSQQSLTLAEERLKGTAFDPKYH